MSGIYIASKTIHAPKWLAFRAAGHKITCSWIDEAKPGDSPSLENLWVRCINEAREADVLILYCEEGEQLKGAYVELGAALAHEVPCIWVGPKLASAANHPLITHVFNMVDEALPLAAAIMV
jgi:hypothetical protein